ncbi:helix-turn-helix domain-containing protein [Massilia sp. Leaf139]|uniref:helix-turn-helix domain-containing protein n=1 Tax=Massilia sp. Leaf139 TaxID=1736272 RepID=UPI0019105403|nr:helix-turn-helix domain-containing protein [Massilia sp. Leaf139]
MTTFDPYVLDVLMPDLVGHEHSPSAFLIYCYLWHRIEAAGGRAVQLSYATMALDTGLSRITAQRAIALLLRRQLVSATSVSRTAVPSYLVLRTWAARKNKVRIRDIQYTYGLRNILSLTYILLISPNSNTMSFS